MLRVEDLPPITSDKPDLIPYAERRRAALYPTYLPLISETDEALKHLLQTETDARFWLEAAQGRDALGLFSIRRHLEHRHLEQGRTAYPGNASAAEVRPSA